MIKLLLPVIFPSWRFFSSIGPSPRIHIAFLQKQDDAPEFWEELRPQQKQLSFKEAVFRLIHDPEWNDFLYINSCAERLFEGPSEMREREIMRRILARIDEEKIAVNFTAQYIQYRISAVIREDDVISQPIVFMSSPVSLPQKPPKMPKGLA